MAKKLFEVKKGFIVMGFVLLLLTLVSPSLPWVSTGYSIDGIIRLGRIQQIKYSESLAINFDLFGRGYGSYTVLVGESVETTEFYAYMPQLRTFGYLNLIGSLIASVGLATLIIYGFLDLPILVALIGTGLVIVGGGINLGVSLAISSSYIGMTMILNGKEINLSDYYNSVLVRISHVPETLLGVPNFCGLGIGNFINLLGGLGMTLIGIYLLANVLYLYLKPPVEEEPIGVIPE